MRLRVPWREPGNSADRSYSLKGLPEACNEALREPVSDVATLGAAEAAPWNGRTCPRQIRRPFRGYASIAVLVSASAGLPGGRIEEEGGMRLFRLWVSITAIAFVVAGESGLAQQPIAYPAKGQSPEQEDGSVKLRV